MNFVADRKRKSELLTKLTGKESDKGTNETERSRVKRAGERTKTVE